jgi:hypothetical protein
MQTEAPGSSQYLPAPAPVQATPPTAYVSAQPMVVQQSVINVGSRRSVFGAVVLALLFGPLGMLYSTVLGALVMFFVSALVGIPTLGLGLLITIPLGAIWAGLSASAKNRRIGTTVSQAVPLAAPPGATAQPAVATPPAPYLAAEVPPALPRQVPPPAPPAPHAFPQVPPPAPPVVPQVATWAPVLAPDDSSATRSREDVWRVAIDMARRGTSRDQTTRYLAQYFEPEEREGLLDAIYSIPGVKTAQG